MTEFYMIWIAGHGVPKKIYASIESARFDAESLRADVTGREVYILAPLEVIEGRKLLEVTEGKHPAKQKVEPVAPKRPIITLKKKRSAGD